MEYQYELRNKSYEDYGISIYRYKELKAFCMQYHEKKDKIKYGITAMNYDGQPKGNSVGSAVEGQAIENEMYKRDCRIIEEAAIQTNPGIWKYILKSVTLDLPYTLIEYDEEFGRIPVGKTDFYANRRLFYYNLNKIKIGDKLR